MRKTADEWEKELSWLNIALINSIAFTKHLKSSSFVSDQISRRSREKEIRFWASIQQFAFTVLYPLGMIAEQS